MTQTIHSKAVPSHDTRHQSLDVYDDGHLRVEHDNYYVTCRGEPIKFPRTEFLLLSRLARNATRIVKAEELWRHVWGDSKPYNAESLHVHIYRLRSKLSPFRIKIETMVNVGYRLVLDTKNMARQREPDRDAATPF